MRLTAILLMTWAVLAQVAGAAEQQLTREQASHALTRPDPVTRRAAAGRLAEVGRMGDVTALVRALRDSDAE